MKPVIVAGLSPGMLYRLLSTALLLHLLQEALVYAESSSSSSTLNRASAAIQITEARFVASNAIRVSWKTVIPLSSSLPCDWLLMLEHASSASTNSTTTYSSATLAASKRRHTFWNIDSPDANYTAKVVLRTTNAGQLSSDRQAIPYEVVQPVALSACRIDILNAFTESLDITRETEKVFAENDVITISCDLLGSPSPRVRWYRDDSLEDEGNDVFHSNRLILANARKAAEGLYRMTADNPSGLVLFPGVRLKMAVLESISSLNELPKLTVESGVGQALDCPFNGRSVPQPTLRWYRVTGRTDPRPRRVETDNHRVFMSITGSLVFANTKSEDSSIYMCMADNSVLDKRIEASLRQLEVVESQFANFSAVPVLLFKSTEIQKAFVGGNASFQCIFSGRPIPQTTWHFTDSVTSAERRVTEELHWQFHLKSNGTELIIRNVSEVTPTQFHCEGRNSAGTSQPTRLQMLMSGKPEFLVAPKSLNASVGDTVTFTYKVKGHPKPEILWSSKGEALIQSSSVYFDETSLTLVNVTKNSASSLQLNISNIHGHCLVNVVLNVFDRTKISVLRNQDEEKGFVSYECEAETDVQTHLNMEWLPGDRSLSSSSSSSSSSSLSASAILFGGDRSNRSNGDRSTLVFDLKDLGRKKEEDQRIQVNFTCSASNGLSNDTWTEEFVWTKNPKSSTVEEKQRNADDRETHSLFTYLGYVACSVVLVFIVSAVTLRRLLRQRSMLSRRVEPTTDRRSSSLSTGATQDAFPPRRSSSVCCRGLHRHHLRYDGHSCKGIPGRNNNNNSAKGPFMANFQEVFISRDRIHVSESVAEGRFSHVSLAFLHDPRSELRETVAVKTLRSEFVESDLIELYLREAEVSVHFQHVNVLRVLGVSIDATGQPSIVQPFMANGDLQRYIRNPRTIMTAFNLLQFGLQVVRGMAYLSVLPVVHCHLRTKACLINSRGIVKVADFGLTRELVMRDQWCQVRDVMRWMSPETLEAHIFTTMSDVWSFGMLLWELLTRGTFPFGEITECDILKCIQSGQRPPPPMFCPEEIYGLMVSCWSVDPMHRPNFVCVEEVLHRMTQSAAIRADGSGPNLGCCYVNAATSPPSPPPPPLHPPPSPPSPPAASSFESPSPA